MPEETVKAIVWSSAGPARDSLYYYRARYYDRSLGRLLHEKGPEPDPTALRV